MTDQPLVQVSPQRLIVSFLLSSEWLIPAAITIIIVVATAAVDMVPLALGGLIPLLIGMVSLIWRRVIGMFNFTLAESPRGLRITRGLTNLTSQSVPINRIQGVKVSQPMLWRLFRLVSDGRRYSRLRPGRQRRQRVERLQRAASGRHPR